MNRRMGQLVVALVLFALAVILSYFSIEEKEVRTTQPADVMLVLDVSTSMGDQGTSGDTKLEEAKEAAREFLSTINPSIRSGLIIFADRAQMLLTLTEDKNVTRKKVDELSCGGWTAMGDGIGLAVEALSESLNDDRYILLMSDGASNREEKYSPEDARDLAAVNGIIVHTVAFGGDADRALLQNIADTTGGEFFFAATGRQLVDAFTEIADGINQNLVYYYGSRGLLFVSVILIIFLPEIVERARTTLFRQMDEKHDTRSYGGEKYE
jgi:Ca-activated chloride channel family protein